MKSAQLSQRCGKTRSWLLEKRGGMMSFSARHGAAGSMDSGTKAPLFPTLALARFLR